MQEMGVRILSDTKAFSFWNYFNGGSRNSVILGRPLGSSSGLYSVECL